MWLRQEEEEYAFVRQRKDPKVGWVAASNPNAAACRIVCAELRRVGLFDERLCTDICIPLSHSIARGFIHRLPPLRLDPPPRRTASEVSLRAGGPHRSARQRFYTSGQRRPVVSGSDSEGRLTVNIPLAETTQQLSKTSTA